LRPIFTPARLARSLPSLVLILISSRSNSARPPSTVSISLPAGVVVSAQGSARDLNNHSLSAICFTVVRRSMVDRANRSNRVTTTTAPGSKDFMRLRNSGRSLRIPLAFSLWLAEKITELPTPPEAASKRPNHGLLLRAKPGSSDAIADRFSRRAATAQYFDGGQNSSVER